METKFKSLIQKYMFDKNAELQGDEKLKDLGLDSMTSIDLLLELETVYDISIPMENLNEHTFATPANLWHVVQEIKTKSNL
jgi:acyl carrier protein